MRHLQGRTNLLKESNAEVHALLLGGGQAIPPLTELIGELDFPGHALSMSCAALCRQGYIRAALWGANQLARLWIRLGRLDLSAGILEAETGHFDQLWFGGNVGRIGIRAHVVVRGNDLDRHFYPRHIFSVPTRSAARATFSRRRNFASSPAIDRKSVV